MPADEENARKQSKGERTSRRIMDIAEDLFARQGYDGTSLRQIAEGAGIKEPGLYNHFGGKQALYEAVLFRALNPMAEALGNHLDSATGLRNYTDLPAIMTDLLLLHPQMAALFQQAMQGDSSSIGNIMVSEWLEKLFNQGMHSLEKLEHTDPGPAGSDTTAAQDRKNLAINLIAMFNLTTGYFLSQRAFSSLASGDLTEPENIARQKKLLRKVIRAMLIS
jgi:AcrR family transcriptional regulator